MPRVYVQWNLRWNSALGLAPDRQLAAKWGVSIASVRLHRVQMGIPAAKKKLVPCSTCGKQIRRWRYFKNVVCKDCRREYNTQWRNDHKEEYRVAERNRYHNGPRKEQIKAWKRANPEKEREYRRRNAEKMRKQANELLGNLPCLECGMQHTQEVRDRILRRMLPCTTAEIHEAWECIWGPCGNQYRNTAGAMMLSRDLKRIGAWTPKVGTGHYELPRRPDERAA